MQISIAIDGPAGAGKSTIAKLLADKYNLMYINTGAMYRVVTLKAMENKISPENEGDLIELIKNLNMYFNEDRIIVNEEDLTDKIYMPIISKNVSYYSSIKEVRKLLVYLQRSISDKYSVIMDGRDIGTVVLKNASLKIFLTASPDTRAKRRYKELAEKGLDVKYQEILDDIKKRDYLDSNREVSPLTKAKDAIEIDGSNLNIHEVVALISKYIDSIILSGEKQ
ncbi:(d)CMP kinase [Haloimpatiens sp. FM7315]|uniref:(d)CMP kinase n=1 Tax=Haloimpatiens sp. FM7315 TaxID=3298609 RepID=UPI00370C565A